MGLSSRAILDVVELVYYAPALLLSLWVIRKQSSRASWIYLALLSIIRIVGAATGIAADNDPSTGLIETSLIAYAVGLSPLCLCWLYIIIRVNEGMHTHRIPHLFLAVIQLPVIAGLALGIVGGIDLYSSSASTRHSGVTYSKIGVLIFLAVIILLAAVTVVTFLRRRHVMAGEERLVFACLISIPFLFVRIAYSIIVDFDRSSTVFSFTSTRNVAVVVLAVMSVAMEFIVVTIFLTAGLVTPAIPRGVTGSNAMNSVQQPGAQYGGLGSRDNSPTSYPLTGAQYDNNGYAQGQQVGVKDRNQEPYRG